MTTTRYIIFIVLVTSAIILSGCKLSASTPPAVTETPDSAMSTLEAELGSIATQTHVAGGGEIETAPASGRPAAPGRRVDPAFIRWAKRARWRSGRAGGRQANRRPDPLFRPSGRAETGLHAAREPGVLAHALRDRRARSRHLHRLIR